MHSCFSLLLEAIMISQTRSSFRAYPLVVLCAIFVLLLSACGGTSTTGTGDKGPITIGGKLDVEAQLFTEFYSLLLVKNGFKVNEKLAYGKTPANFQAIQKGSIDLYAEFTGTALSLLDLKSTYDPQKDYDAIKDQYKQKYKITWLDRSASLNDGYALCMSKEKSQSSGITTLSQLAAKVSDLVLETPSDGTPFVDGLKTTYNFDSSSFKKADSVDSAIGLTAVSKGQADVAVCYGTDISVPAQNLVFLQDDKNGFPAFNPAPIIRDEVLTKYPEIQTILKPLADVLTTDISISLQQQVADKRANMSATQAIKEVAKSFLTDKKLL
jgi:osmoprotectant transport system substrate-binding protein